VPFLARRAFVISTPAGRTRSGLGCCGQFTADAQAAADASVSPQL